MQFKRCNKCNQDLPRSEFSKHGNGLQSKCKACNRLYQKAHYRANKADYIAKAAIWMDARLTENAIKVLAYFESHPCVDCGETDPLVLQFDHVRGKKMHEVSKMWKNGSRWELIAAEMAKCEVRCANCHWRRHALARGWRKAALIGLATSRAPLPL
jgi:phage FluMu protein Com